MPKDSAADVAMLMKGLTVLGGMTVLWLGVYPATLKWCLFYLFYGVT